MAGNCRGQFPLLHPVEGLPFLPVRRMKKDRGPTGPSAGSGGASPRTEQRRLPAQAHTRRHPRLAPPGATGYASWQPCLRSFSIGHKYRPRRQASRGYILSAKTITPTQSRMARAALDWPIEASAAAAGISSRTLLRFENEQRDIKPELIAALRRTYQAAGVRFLDD